MQSSAISGVEFDRLAELHLRILPTSMISFFGPSYTRAFYRFAKESDKEVVFCNRDEDRVVGGAVLSLAPVSLTRRLALQTPLLASALANIASIEFWHHFMGMVVGIFKPPPQESGVPEMIIIFIDEDLRGRGIGGRRSAFANV